MIQNHTLFRNSLYLQKIQTYPHRRYLITRKKNQASVGLDYCWRRNLFIYHLKKGTPKSSLKKLIKNHLEAISLFTLNFIIRKVAFMNKLFQCIKFLHVYPQCWNFVLLFCQIFSHLPISYAFTAYNFPTYIDHVLNIVNLESWQTLRVHRWLPDTAVQLVERGGVRKCKAPLGFYGHCGVWLLKSGWI